MMRSALYSGPGSTQDRRFKVLDAAGYPLFDFGWRYSSNRPTTCDDLEEAAAASSFNHGQLLTRRRS